MQNGAFWRGILRGSFVKEIRALHDAAVLRLLPTFERAAEEADAVAAAEWERIGQLPASDGDYDMATAAESAQDEGIEHYQRLMGVRQALLNLVAAGLYHLFEQAATFTRRHLLSPAEENSAVFMKSVAPRLMDTMRERLLAAGIVIESLASWEKLYELRLVANTVKHGAGRSADELYSKQPLLFTDPDFRPGMPLYRESAWRPSIPRVDRPLSGEDIFVTADELSAYASAIVAFWEALGNAIAA